MLRNAACAHYLGIAMNLFAYGTLKNLEFIQLLLNRSLDMPTSAVLPGFTTVTSKWGFPVMVPAEESKVDGIVWRDLTDRDFEILDSYEGFNTETPVYQREKRKVIVEGREEEVWAYFGTPAFLNRAPCQKKKQNS